MKSKGKKALTRSVSYELEVPLDHLNLIGRDFVYDGLKDVSRTSVARRLKQSAVLTCER